MNPSRSYVPRMSVNMDVNDAAQALSALIDTAVVTFSPAYEAITSVTVYDALMIPVTL